MPKVDNILSFVYPFTSFPVYKITAIVEFFPSNNRLYNYIQSETLSEPFNQIHLHAQVQVYMVPVFVPMSFHLPHHVFLQSSENTLRLGFPTAPHLKCLTLPVSVTRRTVLQKVRGRAYKVLPQLVDTGFQEIRR